MTLKMRTFAPLTLLLLSLGVEMHQPASTAGKDSQVQSNPRPSLWSAKSALSIARAPL